MLISNIGVTFATRSHRRVQNGGTASIGILKYVLSLRVHPIFKRIPEHIMKETKFNHLLFSNFFEKVCRHTISHGTI